MMIHTVLFFFAALGLVQAAEPKRISLPRIQDLQRSEIYVLKMSDHPSAVLILCPGCNGNGKDWIENSAWQEFARKNNLDLVGISFASDVSLLKEGKGYYYPQQGSGKLLLDGIRQAYGRDLPFLMYGFSGGAHYVSGFVEWKPDRIIAWCAYSAEWWSKPTANGTSPPGVIACGADDERLGASLTYFKEGRALGKPWLWLCAPLTGHAIYPPAEAFVREYFASILNDDNNAQEGEWVDIDRNSATSAETVRDQPSVTGWLPSNKLLPIWQKVHQP